MKFGKINNFILFGGGRDLLEFALYLKQKKYPVVLFSCLRHLQEIIIDNKTLEQCLEKNKITYFDTEDINKDNRLDEFLTPFTIGLSSSAAWLFKKELIDKFNGRLLNSHGTRLPKYRGGGGPSWRILRNDNMNCSLLHQVEVGYDTGDIVKIKEYIYPPHCSVPEDYIDYTIQKDILFLKEFLEDLEAGRDFKTITQQEHFSVYFPRLCTKEQGFINWSWEAKELELFIRAFDDPYPGASTFIGPKRVYLKKCCLDCNDGTFHPFQTGIVYRKTDVAIFIAIKEGTLIVKEIFDDNNINIIKDIKLGGRLYTPQKYLDAAMTHRTFYDSQGIKHKNKKTYQ